jgi:hypothetical protein
MTQEDMDAEFSRRLNRLQKACPEIPSDVAVVLVRRYLKYEMATSSSRRKQWLKAASSHLAIAEARIAQWKREIRRRKGGRMTDKALGGYLEYRDFSKAIGEILYSLPPNLREDALDGFESYKFFHSAPAPTEKDDSPKRSIKKLIKPIRGQELDASRDRSLPREVKL